MRVAALALIVLHVVVIVVTAVATTRTGGSVPCVRYECLLGSAETMAW